MTATQRVQAALDDIAARDPQLGAFTAVLADRALARAAAIDAGNVTGPLVGMPFAVKNLFDVAGLPTLAGSAINRDHPPATADSPLITRLEHAGAVLVGTLNMGEYAYDFTGENIHYGPSRNPHDLTRMSGGSSGGSGTAVGAGLVALALGSDTNGSIRVPASLCGIFGLKPTYGRLPRNRSFPFVASLDHLGPLARNVTDLALAYDAMQGPEPLDPACAQRPIEPTVPVLDRGIAGLRMARLGGYFRKATTPEADAAVETICAALGVAREVDVESAGRARAAAYIITASEGAALHLQRLRTDAAGFDPAVRDRLIAGAMIPAVAVQAAQRFRRWFAAAVREAMRDTDVLIAPATPCTAPSLGQTIFVLDGVELPVRANLGIFTQPISFIGLPVVAVPLRAGNGLPIGVQIIARPWAEATALRVARHLEQSGTVAAL